MSIEIESKKLNIWYLLYIDKNLNLIKNTIIE